jgi:hypothetical protein
MVKAYSFCGNQEFYDFDFKKNISGCQVDCVLPFMKDLDQKICA